MPTPSGISLGSALPESITNKIVEAFRSKAIKIISKTILGHNLEQFKLWGPTYCSRCSDLIWGLVGHRCKLCKLVSHVRCFDLINCRCIFDQTNRNLLDLDDLVGSSHPFQATTFMIPTYCDHCGTLIKGIYKQGLQCSSRDCNMKVHYDCKKLVGDICGQKNWTISKPKKSATMERTLQEKDNQWSTTTIGDFHLIRELGTGTFSKVYLAEKNFDRSRKFAIKVIMKRPEEDPQGAFTEMKVLKLGRSYPFLISGHCCFQSRERLFFVMEYLEGGTLFQHLSKNRKFSESVTRFYSAEIILALIYLHNHGILHRDIKLENVLLDEHGHCKITDFGLSGDLKGCPTTRTYCGTPFNMSPEMLERLDYGPSVDWWALGVLMYEMLLGHLPFDENHGDDELFRQIRTENIKYPSSLSCKAKRILEGLLTRKPEERLGCRVTNGCEQELLEHTFYLEGNVGLINIHSWWRDLEAKRITPPYRPRLSDLEKSSNDEFRGLSTISPRKMDGVRQSDFENFSYKSESFDCNANLIEI